MKKAIFVIIVVFITGVFPGCQSNKQEELSIIPVPYSARVYKSSFVFPDNFKVYVPENNQQAYKAAEYFKTRVSKYFQIDIEASTKDKPEQALVLVINKSYDTQIGKEGYKLYINKKGIKIKANKPAGLFYGIQTILQLFPEQIWSQEPKKQELAVKLPCLKIVDFPQYRYRGMHLDVGRHFFPVSSIKKYIDYIAMHKMNVFHWHLTEDQGWRIEIKKYPGLTSVGAWRKETLIGSMRNRPYKFDHKRYGGYYTQDQIKEIVKYALDRFITVIPEIELPGHSVAALAAYPGLSCTGGPFEVRTRWGISKDIYCAGKEKTFEFLQNVLTEVMDLFPSEYIHIGGDEAPKERWEKCPDCQKRIKQEGLKDEHELQSYFIRRIEKFLNAHGRKIIGWDEILEGGLAPNATVMSWRGISGGIAAARSGHDVIMTPTSHCYFDYYQGDPSAEPLAIGGFTDLKKVYSFKPCPTDSLSEDQWKYIIGGQGNVWTEYIKTWDYAEYMFLPRMCALSEVLWSPESKHSWQDFSGRMDKQYKRLMYAGASFRIPCPEISRVVVLKNEEKLKIENPLSFGIIRFTTDGSDPDEKSPVYKEPVELKTNTIVKTRIFLPDGRKSSVRTSQILMAQTAPQGKKYGMHYEYFRGDFSSGFDGFSKKEPEFAGCVYLPDPNNLPGEKDLFGVRFSGYLNIKKRGTYRFRLFADDGAEFTIDNKIITENKNYTERAETGDIYLKKGLHPFEIKYYERYGAQILKLWFKGPGMKMQAVLPEMFLCDGQ